MKKAMLPKELSDDIKQILRDKFDNDFRIRSLNAQAQRHLQAGHYAEAMKIRQQIETLYDRVLVGYCCEVESQVKEVTLEQAKVPEKDQQRINQLMVTLYMAVDIMDSCLLDINDTLHHTDKSLSYDKIIDLQELAHLCKEQMTKFGEQMDYTKYPEWGDITDNMYEMMQRKAKSIIRKTHEYKTGEHKQGEA